MPPVLGRKVCYWACPFLAFCKVGWNMFLLRKWTVSKVLFCIASLESHYTFIHLDDSQTYNSKILLLKTCLSLKWNCKNLILRSAIFCITQLKYNCYSKVLFSFIHSIFCVCQAWWEEGTSTFYLFIFRRHATCILTGTVSHNLYPLPLPIYFQIPVASIPDTTLPMDIRYTVYSIHNMKKAKGHKINITPF